MEAVAAVPSGRINNLRSNSNEPVRRAASMPSRRLARAGSGLPSAISRLACTRCSSATAHSSPFLLANAKPVERLASASLNQTGTRECFRQQGEVVRQANLGTNPAHFIESRAQLR